MSVGPDQEGPTSDELMRLGADIVSAYVSRNAVAADAVPDIIRTVHQALTGLADLPSTRHLEITPNFTLRASRDRVVGEVAHRDNEIVPSVELPFVTPFTCQVTAVLPAFWTVAVNCCWLPQPAESVTRDGEIDTDTGAVIVTVAEPLRVESALETAVTVTVPPDGTLEGAL